MPSFEPTEITNGERVAWVTQGLVLYFDRELAAVWPDVLRAWDYLLGTRFAAGFKFLRRWDAPAWQPWDPTVAPHLRDVLERRGPHEPFWHIELADNTELPELSFDFQSVPASLGKYPRASHLRVRVPMNVPAEELVELTRQLTELLPVQQGLTGYLCHVSPHARAAAFDQAWAWARRYYGLHILDPVEAAWDAPRGLWGTNWLTVVGTRWTEAQQPLAAVDWAAFKRPLSVIRSRNAIILRAGEKPTLGDQNDFADLSAYTLAASALEPALIADPSSLPGMFTDHDSTKAWLDRFLDPTRWRDSG